MRRILIFVIICALYACNDSSQLAQLKTSNPGTRAATGSFMKSSSNARIDACTSNDVNCYYSGVEYDPDTGISSDVNTCTNISNGQSEECYSDTGPGDAGAVGGTDGGDAPRDYSFPTFTFPMSPRDGQVFYPKDNNTYQMTNYRFIYSYCSQRWLRGPVVAQGTPPSNPTCGTTYTAMVGGWTYNYVYSGWCSSTSSGRTVNAGWYLQGPSSTGTDSCPRAVDLTPPPSSSVVATVLTKMNHAYFVAYIEYSLDGGTTWIQMSGNSVSSSMLITGAVDDVYQFRARIYNFDGTYGHAVNNIHITTPWGSTSAESWSDPQYNSDGSLAFYVTAPSPPHAIHSSCSIFVYVQ